MSDPKHQVRGPGIPTSNGGTVDLFGMRVDRVTEGQIVERVITGLRAGRGGWIVTPNSDHLRLFTKSREVRDLVAEADYSVADGMPLVWASRLQGEGLPERVAGSDLIWLLTEAAEEENASIFLLGGDEGVAEKAARELATKFPGLREIKRHRPPRGFESDPLEMDRIKGALVAAQPDIVFVGLGFPKQERLISQLRSLLPRAWFIGIGISLSFVSGDVQRAPRWMQSLGFEWLHRLLVDLKLFRRYLIHDLPFVIPMLARSARIGLVRGIRRRIDAVRT